MRFCEPPQYPPDWDEIAEELKEDVGRCENCLASGSEAQLEVHHVVPVGSGGSHLRSNLKILCHQCHKSVHKEDEMARVIEFFTGWKIPDEDFEVFRNYLKSVEMRPHGGDGFYIPIGEIRGEMSEVKEVGELVQED